MNILIVDGNEKLASDKYIQAGMDTQYEVYKKLLIKLLDCEINLLVIHPASAESYLPKGVSLDNFQGIVWTGSLLNIYDLGPAIIRQIDLAKELFTKKNKIFGSCWGLQVLSTAAGGKVRKNPKGLEAVIGNNIKLNDLGIKHPMYKNKPKIYDAFCWHYDEVEELPENADILAYNQKSSVQSLAFSRGDSEIWAVQYHPEFNPQWISGLMKIRKKILMKEGSFNSEDEFNKLSFYLSDIEKNNYLKKELQISNSLVQNNIHTIELSNWLNQLKINN